ncbi:hypothetical protein T02_1787 [Trichinella nativa]|uniref:Uncharacterized protein n=1 Tax=Trichinella nativa TaxID=6335 RepID=A0A0V1LDJ2_9BILA|nr:hypothetical protein T02_1787 [Trichinella nativa]
MARLNVLFQILANHFNFQYIIIYYPVDGWLVINDNIRWLQACSSEMFTLLKRKKDFDLTSNNHNIRNI